MIPELGQFVSDEDSFTHDPIANVVEQEDDDDEDDANAENDEDEGDLTQQTVTANDDSDESDESDGEDEEDDDFQSDYEAEVPEEILHITESNETNSLETPVVGDDAEGGKSMANPHLVKGRDGRQYPVTQLVLKFYGNKHSNRQHSRLQRFFENEPYQIMTNNPRGFGAAASLLDACSLSRNDFVVFASECGKKRRKDSIFAGKIMWFVNYYDVKGKRRGEGKACANTMEDDVLLKCYRIRRDGEIQPSKIRFRLVPIKKLCDQKYKLQVKDGKICAFNRNQFSELKKELLKSLSAERDLQRDLLKAKMQLRVDNMTCPLSSMTRSQVMEELKRRLKESEATLRPRLSQYAATLKCTDSEAEKLLLPILKHILRHLRENPTASDAEVMQ